MSQLNFNPNISSQLDSGYYERLFKQFHSQLQGETFTGLLLVYPSHIVHIVEVTIFKIYIIVFFLFSL